jgi:hypothetical protein
MSDQNLLETEHCQSIIVMQESQLDLNTHKYDGPIGLLYHRLIIDDMNETTFAFEDCLQQIEQWLNESLITEKTNISRSIHLLKNDKQNNYDPINKINVEELLPRVINIVKNYDSSGRDLFLTVLGEIVELGPCPQGRTTRLLNFYIPSRT